jgi:hypothetical protein
MRHIDPRFGIADYGPADATIGFAPRRIRIGTVGGAKWRLSVAIDPRVHLRRFAMDLRPMQAHLPSG